MIFLKERMVQESYGASPSCIDFMRSASYFIKIQSAIKMNTIRYQNEQNEKNILSHVNPRIPIPVVCIQSF